MITTLDKFRKINENINNDAETTLTVEIEFSTEENAELFCDNHGGFNNYKIVELELSSTDFIELLKDTDIFQQYSIEKVDIRKF